MSSEDLAIVRGMYDGLAKGDVNAFMNGLDPKIEWIVAPGFPYAAGNPYVGRGSVMGLFGRIMSEWKRFKINGEEFLDAGDHIVVLGHYSAVHRTTGKDVVARFAHIGELRDGKVVRYRQITDSVQFVRAMTPDAAEPAPTLDSGR